MPPIEKTEQTSLRPRNLRCLAFSDTTRVPTAAHSGRDSRLEELESEDSKPHRGTTSHARVLRPSNPKRDAFTHATSTHDRPRTAPTIRKWSLDELPLDDSSVHDERFDDEPLDDELLDRRDQVAR